MKKLIAVTACALLAATAAFGQGMSQQEKDMARRNPIPGNTNAGGSSAAAPSTASPEPPRLARWAQVAQAVRDPVLAVVREAEPVEAQEVGEAANVLPSSQ